MSAFRRRRECGKLTGLAIMSAFHRKRAREHSQWTGWSQSLPFAGKRGREWGRVCHGFSFHLRTRRNQFDPPRHFCLVLTPSFHSEWYRRNPPEPWNRTSYIPPQCRNGRKTHDHLIQDGHSMEQEKNKSFRSAVQCESVWPSGKALGW